MYGMRFDFEKLFIEFNIFFKHNGLQKYVTRRQMMQRGKDKELLVKLLKMTDSIGKALNLVDCEGFARTLK